MSSQLEIGSVLSSQFINPSSALMEDDGEQMMQEEQQPIKQKSNLYALMKDNFLKSKRTFDENAVQVQQAFYNFLINGYQFSFKHEDETLYKDAIRKLEDEGKTTLLIDYAHLVDYDESLARVIRTEYTRFEEYIKNALVQVVETVSPKYLNLNHVQREFFVSFYGMPEHLKVRELRSDFIGKLTAITGTVTRTSIVRPELISGTFQCLECNEIYPNVVQQYAYTTPTQCVNALCNNQTNWELIVEKSRFVDWQKVRIQENSEDIPAGSMPRSIDVIVRHEMCEIPKPGDKCVFTGSLIGLPEVAQILMAGRHVNLQKVSKEAGRSTRDAAGSSGVRGLNKMGCRELSYRLAFMACTVQTSHDRYGHFYDDDLGDDVGKSEKIAGMLSAEERHQMLEMIDSSTNYEDLINSICPNIYGHRKVKEGLLLLLLGGVHKTTPEGTNKLRGDINVCILGDPGLSKSQFLKYIAHFLPRGIYTSGKASSAAGLTATVIKDEETGDFTIEAGALMLADNGICCIDEFDKMEIKDQVAIHEAMEQQTISIAKAGIHATLNARTSILAACNPIGGRYDKKKSLRQNVNLSPPIMSRFDLFFILLDHKDAQQDLQLAKHIIKVHQDLDAALSPKYSIDMLRRFVLFARALRPRLTEEAKQELIETYQALRQNDTQRGGRGGYRVTVRQLESLIRISEAMSRAHADSEITAQRVKEATFLLQSSIMQTENEGEDVDIDQEEEQQPTQPKADQEGDVQMEQPSTEVKKPRMKITNEEYLKIKKWILTTVELKERDLELAKKMEKLQNQQPVAEDEQDVEEEEEEDGKQRGIRMSELIELYMQRVEEEMQDEEAYNTEQEKIVKMIKRLIKQENCLLALNESSGAVGVLNENSFLVVNPLAQLDDE